MNINPLTWFSKPKAMAGNSSRYDRDRRDKVDVGSKYKTLNYSNNPGHNFEALRENARGVYRESLVARSMVTRYVDHVINTGLTWESTPLWRFIKDAPATDEAKYEWTQHVEELWQLYAESTEADVTGKLTLGQLQRLFYRLAMYDGEFNLIFRYLNAPDRINPLAVQILSADQISTPYDGIIQKESESRGNKIQDGIEYDTNGKAVAIYVKQDLSDFSSKHVKIPVMGVKSGRRFVYLYQNIEEPGQSRGYPELAPLVYELAKLTDYDIAELEAVVGQALIMAMIEADVNARPAKHPKLAPLSGSDKDTSDAAPKAGIDTVEVKDTAIIINKLEPGYQFKGFNPTRPNQNYQAFVDAFETKIAGSLGMPLSILRQKFGQSYSAFRGEVMFFWLNITRRRDDFEQFLKTFYESWFTEMVKKGEIKAPGYFKSPLIKKAWLYGGWNGISRPEADPSREIKAIEKRIALGHTTGEREAKAYNGSDFRENVKKLMEENKLRAEANSPLQPVVSDEPDNTEPVKEDKEDTEE